MSEPAISQPTEPEAAPLPADTAPLWPYLAALGALVVLGIVFGELAHLARRKVPGSLDRVVPAWVLRHRHHWPAVTRCCETVTRLGNPVEATTLTVGVAVVLIVLRRRRVAGVERGEPLFWLAILAGQWSLNLALKAYFQRERPPSIHQLVAVANSSFPSSHSVFAATFFGMLAVVLMRMLAGGSGWARPVVMGICLTMAVLVAATRVWLGVHYPTDVLGGLTLGSVWVVAAWLIRAAWARWRPGRKAASVA